MESEEILTLYANSGFFSISRYISYEIYFSSYNKCHTFQQFTIAFYAMITILISRSIFFRERSIHLNFDRSNIDYHDTSIPLVNLFFSYFASLTH